MFIKSRRHIQKTVHPHTRGDNIKHDRDLHLLYGSPPHTWGQCHMIEIGRFDRGSPPHTWGQFVQLALLEPFLRFTPTHVGTMLQARMPATRSSVHPHTRGDNAIELAGFFGKIGSPPHTWGQSDSTGFSCLPVRFTPTHVGTITMLHQGLLRISVHPHTRGDNALREFVPGHAIGSPPHTWGQ